MVLDDGSGAEQVAFSSDGGSLEVVTGANRVAVVDVVDGITTTVYRVSPGTKAPPLVAGWSRTAAGCCSSRGSRGMQGCRCNTAPAEGGDWVNVFDPVLPYVDFLSWCGRRLALSGGGDGGAERREPDPRVGPPDWRYENLSNDFTRSWIWPACSPNGEVDRRDGHTERSRATAGSRDPRALAALHRRHHRSRLTGAGNAAYEAARWSADGRFILVVRRGIEPDSPGALLLLRFDPSTGTTTRAPGPVARIGPAQGENGHADWSNTSDWVPSALGSANPDFRPAVDLPTRPLPASTRHTEG